MGFLSKILKKEAGKLVSEAIDSVVDTVKETVNDNGDVRVSGGSSRNIEMLWGEEGLRERLKDVLKREWAEYDIRENIPAEEMNAQKGARAYSYGIYQDGQPKAMLMVLSDTDHCEYKRKDIRLAKQACEAKGVPYMNFIGHLPNTTEYISTRLRENVR